MGPGGVAGPLTVSRWAGRSGRLPEALAPGFVGIDERGLPELIAETAHFARFVRFFEGADREAGDWSALLHSDGSVLLALIATVNVEDNVARIRALLKRARDGPGHAERERALHRLLAESLRLAAEIDRWIGPAERLRAEPEGEAVRRLIDQAVDGLLADRLRALVAIAAAAERAQRIEAGLLDAALRFHPRWRIVIEADVWPDEDFEDVWADRLLEALERFAQSFLSALEEIVAAARAAVGPSLADSHHQPHVALLLAFLQLFGRVQKALNGVPERVASYYHQRVIGEAPRPAQPDSLFLALVPSPAAKVAPVVAQGSIFVAGKDSKGRDIRFAADTALAVTGARPTELRLWRPETRGGVRTRVAAAALPVPPAAEGGLAAVLAAVAAATAPLPAVAVGLVVAAPLLEARSGRRRITLTLGLSGVRMPDGVDPDRWPALLEAAFQLTYSTAGGWADCGEIACGGAVAGSDAQAWFRFELAPAAPPLGAAMREAAALRLMLVQDSDAAVDAAPFDCFATCLIASVRIDIAVKALGDLIVSTSAGPSASTPGIAAFGIGPSAGGWLRVAHPALAEPVLDRVVLTLDWAEMPAEGFAAYYRDYLLGPDRRISAPGHPLFDNGRFRVAASPPGGGTIDLALFQSRTTVVEDVFAPASFQPTRTETRPAADGPVSRTSTFAFAPAATGRTEPAVQLRLSAPDYGFGDALFPANVAYAVFANAEAAEDARRPSLFDHLWALILKLLKAPVALAKKIWAKVKAMWQSMFGAGDPPADAPAAPVPPTQPAALMPNPPWRPLLAGLRLDYAAHAVLGEPGSGIRLLHLTALDGPVPVPPGATPPLLPHLPPSPCLDLKVEGWPASAPLSLLVRAGPQRESGPPASVEWHWREQGRWVPVPGARLRDNSLGLTATGLLMLDPPGRSGGPVWLRAAFPAGAAFPAPAAIAFDALSATRVVSDPDAPIAPVPAGSVVRPSGLAGIIRVDQPLASFGGAPAETPADLAARVAERLRHKGRAVLAWDAERLVLDRFPEIAKVRIVPAGSAGDAPLAIVVPAPGGASPPDPERPRSHAELRTRIADHLNAHASAFCRFEVVDPAYVAVDVAATLSLTPDVDESRVERDLRAFLSPWAEPGPDLPDRADSGDMVAAITQYLRERDYVRAVEAVDVTLDPPEDALWIVPVLGSLLLSLQEPAAGAAGGAER